MLRRLNRLQIEMQSRIAIHRSHIAKRCRNEINSSLYSLCKRSEQSSRSFLSASSVLQFHRTKRLTKLRQDLSSDRLSRCVQTSFRSMSSSSSASASSLCQDENEKNNIIEISDEEMRSFSDASMQQLLDEEFRILENIKDHTHIQSDGMHDISAESLASLSGPQIKTPEEKPTMIEMLQNFDPQSPPPPGSPMEDVQVWLECSAQQESVQRYEKMLESARDREDFTAMSTVQRQLLRWYQPMRERIVAEQEAYFASKKNKGANKYGPFLCTLQPEKLAIITTHEATMYALKMGGTGATLMKMSLMIGNAIEAEVNVQRLLRQRLEKRPNSAKSEDIDEGVNDIQTVGEAENDKFREMKEDNWMYGPSHLQRFVDDIYRSDPTRKGKVRIARANRRAMKMLDSAEPWSVADKVMLGAVLIQMLLETATVSFPGKEKTMPAFTHEKVWVSHQKLVGHINMNDDFYKMVVSDKLSCLDAYTSRHKPMVIPPREWVGPSDGGYFLLQTEFMRAHGCKVQEVRHTL